MSDAKPARVQGDRLQGEQRTQFVQIRMTPDELADLDAKANEAGMARATFIRAAINDAHVEPLGELREIARMRSSALNRFGANLNQIVRKVNSRTDQITARALLTELLKLERIGRAILDDVETRR